MKLFEYVEDDQHSLVTNHDFNGMDFVWYSSPVNHYDIQYIYSKISSFDQLEYYAEVYFFLNPDINLKIFDGLFCWLGNRESGRAVRTYGKARISQMIESVYHEKVIPWCRRKRRVIFNPDVIISAEEKMSITATIIGRSVFYTEKDLFLALDAMYRSRIVATQDSISENLGCSKRTIQRLVTPKIKDLIKNNNSLIKREKKISSVIEWIDVLTLEGENLKMRHLKDLTKVRDYSILKEAIYRYENQL